MTWHTGPLLGFDTETTGIDVWNDRIVTTALVTVTPGTRPTLQTELINPGVPIPEGAAAVHGITSEHATRHGRPPEQVLFEVTGRIALAMTNGIPIVGFNLAYDFTILEAENHRHSLPTLGQRLNRSRYGPVVDAHVIDKHYSRRKGSRKLSDTAAHYGVRISADGAHDAGADALASCRLVPRLVAAYPELGAMLPEHLHGLQGRWRKEQMDGLRAYFNRVGKDHDGCDPGWPLRTDAPVAVRS